MRKLISVAMVLAVTGCLVVTQARAEDPPKKPKPTPEELFKKADKDGDGKISLAEMTGKKTGEAADKIKAQFEKLDLNKDGGIDLDEFKAKGKKPKDPK